MTGQGNGFLGAGAGDEACYELGSLFASPWPAVVAAMKAKAAEQDLTRR